MDSLDESLSNAERALRVPVHVGLKPRVYSGANQYSAQVLQQLKSAGVCADIDKLMERSRLHLSWDFEQILFEARPMIAFHVCADEVSHSFGQR